MKATPLIYVYGYAIKLTIPSPFVNPTFYDPKFLDLIVPKPTSLVPIPSPAVFFPLPATTVPTNTDYFPTYACFNTGNNDFITISKTTGVPNWPQYPTILSKELKKILKMCVADSTKKTIQTQMFI